MTLDSAISFFESNALQQFEDAYDRQDTAVMKVSRICWFFLGLF